MPLSSQRLLLPLQHSLPRSQTGISGALIYSSAFLVSPCHCLSSGSCVHHEAAVTSYLNFLVAGSAAEGRAIDAVVGLAILIGCNCLDEVSLGYLHVAFSSSHCSLRLCSETPLTTLQQDHQVLFYLSMPKLSEIHRSPGRLASLAGTEF